MGRRLAVFMPSIFHLKKLSGSETHLLLKVVVLAFGSFHCFSPQLGNVPFSHVVAMPSKPFSLGH